MPTPKVYSAAKRYGGFGVQSAVGTPATTPTFLPIVRSQTKFKNELNIQEQKYATGDYFITVDGIPVEPRTSGVVVAPFSPTVLNAFLAACCLATGPLIAPVPITWFQGNGFDEDVFSDMFFNGGTIVVSGQQPAQINFNFVGITESTSAAARTASVPTYERPYRISNVQGATMLGDAVDRFSSITIRIMSAIQLYFGSRNDGSSYASDTILEELGAAADIVRAYNSATQKAAVLNECGAPGAIVLPFVSTCGATHSHTFTFPNALYQARDTDAQDNAPIAELLTFLGLRATVSPYSPLTLAAA